MFRQCPTAPARRGQSRGWLVLAGLIFLAVAAGSIGRSTAETEEASVTVLAAGDIAFCERDWGRKISDWLRGYSGVSGAPATAALLERLPGAVLALGDLAYWEGTTEEFRDCYDRSWGRYKDRTYPVPGNHEYRSPEARPYFDYWGARAGAAGEGYYSFERGGWHIVALNSNIAMEEGSEQETWLRRDLAASSADCILAYWHHPPFSSGRHGDQPQVRDLYRALYEAGASVVLAGHDHHYERFEPMDPEGRSDPKRGLRSFVVGTGGGQLKPRTIRQPPRDKSEVIEGTTWGVLELTLHPRSYAWRFVPVEGAIFEDSGRSPCVERGPGG